MALLLPGDEAPAWVRALVEDLLGCVRPHAFLGPLGYQWWAPGDPGHAGGWRLDVYPAPSEVRGPSPADGYCFVAGFDWDLGPVLKAFSEVKEVVWHSPARYNGHLDGPGVSVLGSYSNQPLTLRLHAMPPPDEAPACYVNPATGEAWEIGG